MESNAQHPDPSATVQSAKPITRKEIVGYGFGGMGVNILSMLISSYALYFMTDIAGLSVAVAGLIVALSIVFDAITDPLIGYLADKTNSRWGRYRPFLIIGAPIAAVATAMLFSKIPSEGAASAVYYLCAYCLYKLGATMVSMGRHGLTVTLSSDRATRNNIVTVGKLLATPVGILLSYAHQLVKIFGAGNEARGWQISVILYGVVMVGTIWIAAYAARRFDNKATSAKATQNADGQRIRISDAFRAVKGNKALFCLMLAYVTNYIAARFVSSNQQYYAKYYLCDLSFVSLTGTISTVCTIPMFLLVLYLSRRIAKRDIFLYATLGHLVFPILMLCGFADNFYVMVASMALSKLTALMCTMCMQIMLPDCVDYGFKVSGVMAAGVVASVMTFTEKIAAAIGSTASTSILEAAGYTANTTQSATVLTTIILLLTIPTIISDVCSIIGMRLYPIKTVDRSSKKQKSEPAVEAEQ